MNIRPRDAPLALETSRPAPEQVESATRLRLTAIGGILGAIAASACCIAPLVVFSLGISGAWIGNLTGLAPYQPYFIAATMACLGYGYWLVYRRKNVGCSEGATCAKPPPNHIVMTSLVLATILVAYPIVMDVIGPLLRNVIVPFLLNP